MFGRRWWLCSPRRMVVLAALVTGCVLFFNRGDPSNNAYAHLPLNQQGLPEPYFPAPFAAHHEGMRRQALELQNTPQAQEEAKIGFERNSFNQFVSDRIPLVQATALLATRVFCLA
ncbi:hypothetical protein PTSG_11495 [Salpingoeca rosetta]|uniref:Uncharacterized protein n=1 Tax=Salpingoeca rosetta (strain ATCC 50818 / BSB-021) TaxID=946362 RepID=F2UTM6_SALR5|nr:uncharacterized protein PTSG_11495 [Salpingoeca rosetta]EGD73375.1 hypothetical protein PTSG_11495 [Salpingoeca rosetta]|eukprot:XP_004987479.1 hypothetical protein PTSG_11495 [Salpingoeca rosetta]